MERKKIGSTCMTISSEFRVLFHFDQNKKESILFSW